MTVALLKSLNRSGEAPSVNPNFASSAVILTFPKESLFELALRLKEMRKKGYETHHHFRPRPYAKTPFYSSNLHGFVSSLESCGYTRGDFVNASSLTHHGMGILEGSILTAFIEDSVVTHKFLDDLGFNLDPLLQKYLQRYFELMKPR